MLSKNQLAIIDGALRDINKSDYLFANKTVILGGDFRQTLPIVAPNAGKLQQSTTASKAPLCGNFSN